MGSYWLTHPVPRPVQGTQNVRDGADTKQYVWYQYTSTCTIMVWKGRQRGDVVADYCNLVFNSDVTRHIALCWSKFWQRSQRHK